VVRRRRMRVLRVGKPDEWGAVGLLLALEGQNFREFLFHDVRESGHKEGPEPSRVPPLPLLLSLED